MRFLIWNMGNGGPGRFERDHEGGWEHLRKRGDFDIALLQETRDPASVAGDWASIVWRPKYEGSGTGRVLWGSAVVSPSVELAPHEPGDSFPGLQELAGSTAIAQTSSDPMWIASVHAWDREISAEKLERIPLDEVPITTPDRSVWESNVIPYELARLFGDDTFLWGGDLNTDPRMDDLSWFRGGNRSLFKYYAEAGSVDTRLRFQDAFQQTYFKEGKGAYQLDHVFADARTERRVLSWRVDPEPVTGAHALSDHAPILVTLDEMKGS